MSPTKEKTKKRRITFSLNADKAAQVALVGDFNNWSQTTHLMKKNKNGMWEKTLMLDFGRYEYKFLVDGHWQSDPQNGQVTRNCFGTINNVLMVAAP
jgi:1,4-alpha-glucan branching enzyme